MTTIFDCTQTQISVNFYLFKVALDPILIALVPILFVSRLKYTKVALNSITNTIIFLYKYLSKNLSNSALIKVLGV